MRLSFGPRRADRRIELADLAVPEVLVDDDFVTLLIAYSKRDQAGVGAHTDIPAEPDDRLMCPVRAARDWLKVPGRSDRAGRHQGRDQRLGTGRAHKAGMENWQRITGHGLRRGGAQAIADAGGDPTDQDRWKPGSAVVKREYLDRARSRAENPWLKVQEKRRRESEA
ncbi:hypothetical protein [Streptomyces sp. NPDC046712]|uniref:hypothetical protein n=1 Tax=Streptomyces sp. NPDC046712 TaxID=3154802 RepID=UPI003404BA5F